MTGSKWLSDVLDVTMLKSGVLNVVEAPTGSGKTRCAIEKIGGSATDRSKMLYLIDTVNGQSEVLKLKDKIKNYDNFWQDMISGDSFRSDEFDTNRTVVITYAKFGCLSKMSFRFLEYFEYIICDELHSLSKFASFKDGANQRRAKELIEMIVRETNIKVVALTATPKSLYDNFNCSCYPVPIDLTDIKRYETKKTIRYKDLDAIIKNKIRPNEQGILYLSQIETMKKYSIIANQLGISSICIWSLKPENKENYMNKEQLEAREYLLREERIPSQYSLLIINSSSETGITIRGDVKYIICHNRAETTEIQVRGRFRGDLDRLYLREPIQGKIDIDEKVIVPDEFIGIRLFKEDKEKLCQALYIQNEYEKVYKWNTIKKKILEAGYHIDDSEKNRVKNKRYVIITE